MHTNSYTHLEKRTRPAYSGFLNWALFWLVKRKQFSSHPEHIQWTGSIPNVLSIAEVMVIKTLVSVALEALPLSLHMSG